MERGPKKVFEKFSYYKGPYKQDSVWFHGASVGEIMSILPIINEFEKDKKIKNILITSNTISSASIIKKKSLKKTTHVYYPFDIDFICENFLKKWKPKIAVFVDSEIWPNMYEKINSKKIPLILINARITRKVLKGEIISIIFKRSLQKNYHCLTSKSRNKKLFKN